MSYIVKRAKLVPNNKIFGVLHDRIVVGNEAFRENFTPLGANDLRREVNIREMYPKLNSNYNKVNAHFESKLDKDYHKPMMFPSNSMPGVRGYYETYNEPSAHLPLGQFHENVTLTIDNSGGPEDLLAPGTVVFLSRGGALHKIDSTTGEILPIRYSSDYGPDSRNGIFEYGGGCTDYTGTDDGLGWSGVGIQVSVPYLRPYNDVSGIWTFCDPDLGANMYSHNHLSDSRGQMFIPLKMSIIGQDATNIYCSIARASNTIANHTYGTLGGVYTNRNDTDCNPYNVCKAVVSIRKSDGYTYSSGKDQEAYTDNYSHVNIVGFKEEMDPYGNIMSFSKQYNTNSIYGYLNFKYIAPNMNEYRCIYRYNIAGSPHNSVIAHDRWSGPTRFMASRPDTGTAAKMYWMESVAYDHPDPSYPDTHCPIIMMLKWLADPVELSKGADGMVTPTPVQCTLAGLPSEYQGGAGANTLRALLTQSYMDRYEMFEIESAGEQYVVLWMGCTRSPEGSPDWDYSNSSDATSEFYRYCVIFRVDAADDSILHYVSDVGDFKYKKIIYGAVATEDNTTVVFSNQDGVHPMRWNSASESFASLDPILIERVWNMGMSAGTTTDYATCWIETLQYPEGETSGNHTLAKGPSDIYQLQIGDYKDVDLKYIDADTEEHLEFSSNLLITEKDVNGAYIAKTFDILVRVKSQTGDTVVDFDAGNSVAFKISGGNMETDGLYIEGHDVDNPYLKTITSGADWVTVTVNYRLPLTRVTLSATIV